MAKGERVCSYSSKRTSDGRSTTHARQEAGTGEIIQYLYTFYTSTIRLIKDQVSVHCHHSPSPVQWVDCAALVAHLQWLVERHTSHMSSGRHSHSEVASLEDLTLLLSISVLSLAVLRT